MLNMAVMMNGMLPIQVSTEVLTEPIVELRSIDLAKEQKFYELERLLDVTDLTDPFVLFKAALFSSGILVKKGSLKSQLKKLGGGLSITTKVDIPKGSGLGTSSILTGGIVLALSKIMGNDLPPSELSNRVLVAEQLMTSGGGWQDVIGGMYPGMKITTTQPGLTQVYEVSPILLPKEVENELNERGFLMYTGQRRLARSLLKRVVSNYLCNSPQSLSALDSIQRLVYDMSFCLRKRDIGSFGELLSEHMRLLRILDKSCSNLMLDHLMAELGDFAVGSTLCGAAGGGFLYGIFKRGVGLEDLRNFVNKEYGGSAIEVYSCELAN